MAQNRAAWLDGVGKPLRVGDADMPTAGSGELVVKNHAVAINPLDVNQQQTGLFLQTFPVVLGHDVAGEVFDVGLDVTDFNKGDRVIAHAWTMTPQYTSTPPNEAGFNLYTKVKAGVTAILPSKLSFAEGVVLPVALNTAVSGLQIKLGVPWPTTDPKPNGGVVLIYGGSSSIGLSATQLAVHSGLKVISIASPRNRALCKSVGASEVFDYKDARLVEDVIQAIGSDKFVGIYDAISDETTYRHDLEILTKLGGGRLATSYPPPEKVSDNVSAEIMYALGEFAFPLWEKFVPVGLESGRMKCLPEPVVVGKGLESIQSALDRHAAGVSAQKIVVEL